MCCALFSLAAIGAAEYLTYQNGIQEMSESYTVASFQAPPLRDEYESDEEYAEYVAEYEGFMKSTPEEQQEYVEEAQRDFQEFIANDYTFIDYMTSSTYDVLITLLFAFLGISYGYKIGTGASREDD